MFKFKYPVSQTEPPRPARETLPTMYDLPSEDPEEPGLPDEFHILQPQLLSRTLRSPQWLPEQMFTGTDINLYYDVRHSRWYKRPDWFLVVGVPRLYSEQDLRLSYVIWQEGVLPLVVVELLSPGTEAEDLGEKVRVEDMIPVFPEERKAETTNEDLAVSNQGNGVSEEAAAAVVPKPKQKPPRKWEVYESILRVPYYIVFSRYTNQMRTFTLASERYEEIMLEQQPRIWIPGLELGLGLWQGEFEGVERIWLRWYDAQGNWILTDTEQERQEKKLALRQAEQERIRAAEANQRAIAAEALLEQERQEKERLLARLRQLEAPSTFEEP